MAEAPKRLEFSDAAYRAREALEKLLRRAAEDKQTGDAYLKIYFQDGSPRKIRLAYEEVELK